MLIYLLSFSYVRCLSYFRFGAFFISLLFAVITLSAQEKPISWMETFDHPNGTFNDSDSTSWIAVNAVVQNKQLMFSDALGYWISELIPIHGKDVQIDIIFGASEAVQEQDLIRFSCLVDDKEYRANAQGSFLEKKFTFHVKGNLLNLQIEAQTGGSYFIDQVRIQELAQQTDQALPDMNLAANGSLVFDATHIHALPFQSPQWKADFSTAGKDFDTGSHAWMASGGITQQHSFVFTEKGSWISAPIDINGFAQIDLEFQYDIEPDADDLLRIYYITDERIDTVDKKGAFTTLSASRLVSGNQLIIKIESFSESVQYAIRQVSVHQHVAFDLAHSSRSACDVPRGRIQNIYEHGSWRIITDIGTNLRGIGGWWQGVYKNPNRHEDPNLYFEENWWKAMWENGLNVSRAICHDPFWKSEIGPHKGYDFHDPAQVAEFTDKMDRVVELARKNHMYLVINYHDVGRVDMAECSTFWKVVAPRYKDETHVIYELMNEPQGARDWQDEDSRKVEAMYRFVRELAPETYLLLSSFSNMGPNWEYDVDRSMLAASRSLQGIDWTNAGIAFHSYWGENMLRYAEELISEFPAINTEANLPLGYVTKDLSGDDSVRNEPLIPGEPWNQQSMEKLNIGWMTWELDTWREYQDNYLGSPDHNMTNPGKPGLLYHARQEEWLWEFDRDLYTCPPSISEEQALPDITMFPNPVPAGFSEFSIKVPADWIGASIRMFNLQGELVYSGTAQTELMSIQKPGTGIYPILIRWEDQQFVQKIYIH